MTTPTNSRRKFLQSTGVAAATLAAFPPSIRRALAIPAHNATGTIRDVEHIVILMQENRSFDHYFGTLRGVRGFGDRFTIPLPDSRNVWQQLDANGQPLLPYHLDGSTGNAQRFSGTPHSWADGHAAWDGGRMAQWAHYKTPASMGYFKQAELPFQFALANAFTLCDAYHCSMHTGTNSNRMFLWTGSNGPKPAGVASVNNEWDSIGPSTEGYEWKTYPERLQKAKVSWIVYQWMPDNFGDNSLAGFKQYRKANEDSGKPVSNEALSPAYDPATDDAHNPLYKGIANTMPDGGFFGTFRDDIKNGKLPQVSWIVAPAAYSEHPGPSSPVQGAWYIQEALDALTAVPEVWSKTVLFVNFDENDGYFDHVPSPSAPSINPDGTPAGKTTIGAKELAYEYFNHPNPPGTTGQPKQPDGNVYGPGVRVPMYVISPWSRGGWVSSEAFDHTSVIRFIEKRFGVREDNIARFRRAFCGDLTSAFNFANPNNEPLPTLSGRKTQAQADQLRKDQELHMPAILPPANPMLPLQETGIRPSRALPYELHVTSRTRERQGHVRLVFANSGDAGAVFHVYDKLHLDRLPRRYAVEAGEKLDDDWDAFAFDAGKYDLWLLGPNGFHRSFRGDLSLLRPGGAPQPEIRAGYQVAGGDLHLQLRNEGERNCVFTVTSKAYRGDGPWVVKVKGGESEELHWNLDASGQWYDFEVRCDSDGTFRRRLAGRLETGRHSVSDPAFGTPV